MQRLKDSFMIALRSIRSQLRVRIPRNRDISTFVGDDDPGGFFVRVFPPLSLSFIVLGKRKGE